MTKNLNLSNTLSNKKEKFSPIKNNKVGMPVNSSLNTNKMKKILR